MEKIKIYIAAPIVGIPQDWKEKINCVMDKLKEAAFLKIYNPAEHGVPNAWGMTMEEWSKCIFALDCVAIDDCDWVVVCDFGREMTAGTAWEAGYAFGKDKKIFIIRMAENEDNYSVMLNGCSANAINYMDFISARINEEFMDFFTERGKLKEKTGVKFN